MAGVKSRAFVSIGLINMGKGMVNQGFQGGGHGVRAKQEVLPGHRGSEKWKLGKDSSPLAPASTRLHASIVQTWKIFGIPGGRDGVAHAFDCASSQMYVSLILVLRPPIPSVSAGEGHIIFLASAWERRSYH